ncbi:hypothetical protein, partial [Streptomyces sp. NPDC000405]|uniref:hypothetical protein n=1 Tax=Streptomyces sp. NPDC000405 TaxID=3161033 RepID=UPI00398CD8B4
MDWWLHVRRVPAVCAGLAACLVLGAVADSAPSVPELVAEDLVRGHRMDIWDEERKRWFSL